MKLEIETRPGVSWVRGLRFTWDSEAGTLEGPDAEAARRLVREALLVGAVQAGADRRWIPVHDPLHNPMEMALVIGELHKLPPALAAYYPTNSDLYAEERASLARPLGGLALGPRKRDQIEDVGSEGGSGQGGDLAERVVGGRDFDLIAAHHIQSAQSE